MKSRRMSTPFVLCILFLAGGVIFGACSVASAAQPPPQAQSDEIETAVAATLMQYMIETKVAAEATKLFGSAQTVPTQTPVSPTATATPLPTATPLAPSPTPPPPTVAPTATSIGLPTILAEGDTNCRRGPSTQYIIDTIFAEGDQSVVHGRDDGWDWWYIENPNSPGEFCWVWDGSTVVQGDASTLPVVDPPAQSSNYTSNTYYNDSGYYTKYGYHPYGGYYPYPCGTVIYGIKFPKCPPKKNVCYNTNWWTCNAYFYCTCKPVFKDPCKKSGCPPITSVNIATYCDKYPKCCKD